MIPWYRYLPLYGGAANSCVWAFIATAREHSAFGQVTAAIAAVVWFVFFVSDFDKLPERIWYRR